MCIRDSGKALKNGDNARVALKTVNGKKYAFDDEGRMLFGWVDADNAERIDNTCLLYTSRPLMRVSGGTAGRILHHGVKLCGAETVFRA